MKTFGLVFCFVYLYTRRIYTVLCGPHKIVKNNKSRNNKNTLWICLVSLLTQKRDNWFTYIDRFLLFTNGVSTDNAKMCYLRMFFFLNHHFGLSFLIFFFFRSTLSAVSMKKKISVAFQRSFDRAKRDKRVYFHFWMLRFKEQLKRK